MSIETGMPTEKHFVPFVEKPNLQNAITKIREMQPKVVFDVYLGHHTTFEHGSAISQKIHDNDLYLTEGLGWDKEHEERYNETSQGGNPVFPRVTLFEEGELDAIKNSKKPVKFIDYPENHHNVIDAQNLIYGMPHLSEEENIAYHATTQGEREEYMMGQVYERLAEFMDENPDLKEERIQSNEPIRVLFFLGVLHTRIYQGLKEASKQSTRTFPEKPYVYPEGAGVIRGILFGKKPQ